jgi:hypothetical protein
MATMPLTIPVLENWAWPWPIWTLHTTYVCSGLLIALHYIPQIRLAWRHPDATRTAQSLVTWTVWTLCRVVAFVYGIYVVHDLLFLLVIGADLLGRFVMVGLIVRANLPDDDNDAPLALERSGCPPRKSAFEPASEHALFADQPKVLVLGRARGS